MKLKLQPAQHYQLFSSHNGFDVMLNTITNEKSLHCLQLFAAGEVIQKFSAASIVSSPTYLTVQVGVEKHITLSPQFLQYINHSCNPNVFFDTSTFELVALKKIKPGDELTFFYPSTEWEMTQSFVCTCGSKQCLQNIKGAAHLQQQTINTYKFTNFIKSLLQAKTL